MKNDSGVPTRLGLLVIILAASVAVSYIVLYV